MHKNNLIKKPLNKLLKKNSLDLSKEALRKMFIRIESEDPKKKKMSSNGCYSDETLAIIATITNGSWKWYSQ